MTRGRDLLDWYAEHQRNLPWRATRDPYLILVSEVMLQQTPVARVIPFYDRFTKRFPTPTSLAEATLAETLEYWTGLGYPTRVRRLRDTARVVAKHGWPTTASDLQHLPGIGPYTAAAVASIAFGEQIAAVDINVRRVVSRWTGEAIAGSRLVAAANAAICGDAGTWNQAVMELGALVCRPNPECSQCPVAPDCADPTVATAANRQPAYRGSLREVRGAVLRLLSATGATTPEALAAASGHPPQRIESAVVGLVSDGLVRVDGGAVTIAD